MKKRLVFHPKIRFISTIVDHVGLYGQFRRSADEHIIYSQTTFFQKTLAKKASSTNPRWVGEKETSSTWPLVVGRGFLLWSSKMAGISPCGLLHLLEDFLAM
jgi:hypothetical protein